MIQKLIAIFALIAFLISISPYIWVIIQFNTPQNTKASDFEMSFLDIGWLISLVLSIFVIFKINGIKIQKTPLKIALLVISCISILVSCLWAFLWLMILPQFPPP